MAQRVEIGETVVKNLGSLHPASGASVQVNVRDGAATTVYQAATGSSTFSNPLSTDASGRIEGWLESGSYDLVVSGSGITTYTQRLEAVPAGLSVPLGSDDAPELLSRIAAGEKDIALRSGAYQWHQQVVLTGTNGGNDSVSLVGMGKRATVVEKHFNGDLAPMGDGVDISHMSFDGQGDTYTGKGFVMAGADGRQTFDCVRVFDFEDYCLDFARDAGSLFRAQSSDFARYDAIANELYAVRIADVANPLAGRPRHFIGCTSEGAHFMECGSSNDTFITGGIIGELLFSDNSLAVHVVGTRIAGTYAASSGELHVKGANHVLLGDTYPQVILDAGAHHCWVGGPENNAPVLDNSGETSNQIFTEGDTYTPAITSSGTAPALGDGTRSAQWSRHGRTVSFVIEVVAGSTTSLGTGELRLGVPQAPDSGARRVAAATFLDASTNISYVLVGLISAGTSYASLRSHGVAGSIGQGNLPGGVAIAAGDIFRVAGSYDI